MDVNHSMLLAYIQILTYTYIVIYIYIYSNMYIHISCINNWFVIEEHLLYCKPNHKILICIQEYIANIVYIFV